MATALQIIERAYRTIGVLAAGETASADMAQDGLVYLNDVLNGLSNESLAIFFASQDVLPLTGASSYTYGAGGDLDSPRPMTINSAFYRLANVDYPVTILTAEQYNDITVKNIGSSIPSGVFFNPEYPYYTIQLWPMPSTGSLYIDCNKPLLNLSTYNTSFSLPIGYERMLRYALAAEMMPEYGISNPQVIGMMTDAKAWLKRINSKSSILKTCLPFGQKANNAERTILFAGA